MTTLKITKGTTAAILDIDMSNNYAYRVREVTKKILTDYEWDPNASRLNPLKSFSYYNAAKKQLHVPINALEHILVVLDEANAKYEIIEEPWYQERDIKLKMIRGFKPREEQVPIIKYLSDTDPNRKGLATATGSGKTVSSIASIVEYGKAAVVIVSGLQDQWIRQFKHFTNIKDRIYLVQGYQSLIRLMESDFKPDVIVFSLETLRLYVLAGGNYAALPKFSEFLKYMGIGIKIMDEVHLNFHAQTIIDMHSNVRNNIYLTATFNATNRYTRKIMDLIYPKHMRYGEDSFSKYIDVYCYTFKGEVPEKVCSLLRGYMHSRYERYLLKRKTFLHRYFESRISPIIQEHYINKRKAGDRMALYFARLTMVDAAYKYLSKAYPKLNVVIYVGGVEDKAIEKADIIITTPKKSGTGTDIKGLIFVLNTVSFKTPIATDQLRGRLRELKDGRTPVYAELVDLGITSQLMHMSYRAAVHRNNARSYKVINMQVHQ